MCSIEISVAGRTDRAGRAANQDNLWICPDLSRPGADMTNDDRDYPLSAYGALMVVADGMGGMHSGEKASEIVINTIKASFSLIPSAVVRNDKSIRRFMADAIVQADNEVKKFSAANPESKGMGSTIVMAWVVNGKVFIAWVGDSRAYCFNRRNDITRLSHDHSYVQTLVDSGIIADSDALHHPKSNIILHSVGDTEDKVHFDILEYPVHNDDVLLLCSDGLCGLLDDSAIAQEIQRNSRSPLSVLSNLWNAGEQAGWHDNATIAVMRIVKSPVPPAPIPEGWKHLYAPKEDADMATVAPDDPEYAATPPGPASAPAAPSGSRRSKGGIITIALLALAAVFVAAGCYVLYSLLTDKEDSVEETTTVEEVEISKDNSNKGAVGNGTPPQVARPNADGDAKDSPASKSIPTPQKPTTNDNENIVTDTDNPTNDNPTDPSTPTTGGTGSGTPQIAPQSTSEPTPPTNGEVQIGKGSGGEHANISIPAGTPE